MMRYRATKRVGGRVASLVAAALLGTTLVMTSAGAAPNKLAGSTGPKPTIVLVHGAFADASGWGAVIQRLSAKGYPTLAPANPLRGLPVDVPYLQSLLAQVDGPVILVGHSYGGAVITNAAVDNANVKGLVYVAAFAPAEGETTGDLAGKYPGSMLTPANLRLIGYPKTDPSESGYEAYIKSDVFAEVFAADLPKKVTTVMAATQRPADVASLQQHSGPPAWATVPSWFVVATNDHAIPPGTQRFEARRAHAVKTIEVATSHVAMMAAPDEVTELIIDSARCGG